MPSKKNNSTVSTAICHPTWCFAGSVAILCFCRSGGLWLILLNQLNRVDSTVGWLSQISVSIHLR